MCIRDRYDILTKYTGEIVNSIVQVGYIWDALTSEVIISKYFVCSFKVLSFCYFYHHSLFPFQFWNDKKLPDWAQEIFPDKMIHTVIEGFDTFSVKTQTMVQLLVGKFHSLPNNSLIRST